MIECTCTLLTEKEIVLSATLLIIWNLDRLLIYLSRSVYLHTITRTYSDVIKQN